MKESLIVELKTLFIQNKQAKILEICEFNVARASTDIELLYCMASAALMVGDTQKGFQFFDRLLNSVNQTKITRDVLLFLGITALQVAEFIDYFNAPNKGRIYESNVGYAKRMALETQNKELETMAVNFENRILKTSHGTAHIMPKSPEILQIEPTNHCNLGCTMCPRSTMSRKLGYMDIMLWEKIILEWSGGKNKLNGTHLVFNTPFTLQNLNGTIKMFYMGEPLLHPKFDSLIKIAKINGCRIGIQTNGVLLKKPEIRERLLKSGLDEISISLDGIDQSSYNNVRKGSNWSVIQNSIKQLSLERKRMGLLDDTAINISTILLDESNTINVDQVLSFLKPLGPYIDVIHAIELDRSYDPVYLNVVGELQKYVKQVASKIEPSKPFCEEPLKKLNILWDGTVTPCCHDIDGYLTLGDAKKTPIDDIWCSEKTMSLHIALLNHDTSRHPFCKTCKG